MNLIWLSFLESAVENCRFEISFQKSNFHRVGHRLFLSAIAQPLIPLAVLKLYVYDSGYVNEFARELRSPSYRLRFWNLRAFEKFLRGNVDVFIAQPLIPLAVLKQLEHLQTVRAQRILSIAQPLIPLAVLKLPRFLLRWGLRFRCWPLRSPSESLPACGFETTHEQRIYSSSSSTLNCAAPHTACGFETVLLHRHKQYTGSIAQPLRIPTRLRFWNYGMNSQMFSGVRYRSRCQK